MPKQVQILISEETHQQLQELSIEYDISIPSIIVQALASFNKPKKRKRRAKSAKDPDPTHSIVITAEINGEKLPNPDWNAIFKLLLTKAYEKYQSIDRVQALFSLKIISGKIKGRGIAYMDNMDASVHFQSAKNIIRLIKKVCPELGLALRIEIEWPKRRGVKLAGKSCEFILDESGPYWSKPTKKTK